LGKIPKNQYKLQIYNFKNTIKRFFINKKRFFVAIKSFGKIVRSGKYKNSGKESIKK